MECEAVQEWLGAWFDGRLEADRTRLLESHLAVCSECRGLTESLRRLDADLLRTFQPGRDAARHIADRVIAELDEAPAGQTASGQPACRSVASPRWSALLAACAAGFLLATLCFQPWNADSARRSRSDAQSPIVPIPPSVARLVAATGSVQVREKDSDAWRNVAAASPLTCPAGSAVKTGPSTRCELKTADGCVVRMNDRTEVAFNSATAVEVRQGQIWCSSPNDVSLHVLSPVPKGAKPKVPLAVCSANSGMLTAVQGDGGIQVTTDRGAIHLQTEGGTARLEQGETARILAGQIVRADRATDPLLAARWIHPLLIQKGHGDEELEARVNELLARIGRGKLTLLYEHEIRSLGEYGLLPLLRFVQSPTSPDEPQRRRKAMRILTDLAPHWSLPELIELLADADPEVRCLAARALERLTGLNQGRTVEAWREERVEWEPTYARWRAWWDQHKRHFPSPPEVPRTRRST